MPALVAACVLQGMAPEVTMHLAVGTSLATILVTGASSALGHQCRGSIRHDWFLALLPGQLAGVVAGVWLAHRLPARTLRLAFAALLAVVGLTFVL